MANLLRLDLGVTRRKSCLSLIIVLAGMLCCQPTQAQRSDEEFLEFDNESVPSPEQLLQHLNQLRGVNLQLGGTGPRGLPGDKKFQEWVAKELLPSLEEDQREQLEKIARKMMSRRIGGASESTSDDDAQKSEATPSALEALREELRQNPELESTLREQLQRRPGNTPLSDLLRSPEVADTESRDGSSNGNSADREAGRNQTESLRNSLQGSDQRPNQSTSREPNNAELAPGTDGDPVEKSDTSNAESANPSNATGASNGQSRPTNQGGSSTPRNTLTNRDSADLGETKRDSTGADGGDRLTEAAGQGSSTNEPVEEDRSSGFSQVENSGRPGETNSQNASKRPSRPGRGTSGGSQSSFNNPAGNDPADLERDSRPSQSNLSNSDSRLPQNPNESFRDRMNRILLDAAKQSTTADEADEGENEDQRAGPLNGLLNQLASRFQESMQDPERRRRFQQSLERQRNSVSNSRLPSRRAWSSDAISSAGGSSLLGGVLLIGAVAFFVALFFSSPLKDRVLGAVSQYASGLNRTRSYQVSEITNSDELVAAIDRFVFWRFGLGAHWWHGGYVHQQLVDGHPHRTIEIDQLLNAYETARYSQRSDSLDEQSFAATARCLSNLKKESLALEANESPLNDIHGNSGGVAVEPGEQIA